MPVIMICASLVSLLAGAAFPAPPRPILAGTWVLNHAQSDNARALLEERRRTTARARPGMDGPGMGGGMSGGESVGRERTQNVIRSVIEAPEAFTITQDDTSVVFVYGKGRTTVLITDGKPLTDNLTGIGYVDTRASWEGLRLVVERRFDVGGRVVEVYAVSRETGQLVVAVEFNSMRTGKVKFRRIYDPPAEPARD